MYELASWDDVPTRFGDPRCDDFLLVRSCGFEGGLSLGSAFIHKPARYPQCFPSGADADSCCTGALLRRHP